MVAQTGKHHLILFIPPTNTKQISVLEKCYKIAIKFFFADYDIDYHL